MAHSERCEIISKNRKQAIDQKISDEARDYLLRNPETLKHGLYEFLRAGNKLSYNPDLEGWTNEFKEALERYWAKIREIGIKQQLQRLDDDDLVNLDIKRANFHIEAAEQLVDSGLAPNLAIGRKFVEFMTEARGIGTADEERENRRMRAWADSATRGDRG